MLVVVISGMGEENSTQTTSFAFSPGKATSTEGKERGKADR